MIGVGPVLRAILNQLEPGCSQMNESLLLRIAFLWMIPPFRANWEGSSAHSTGQRPTKMNKKNEKHSKIR
jgi:hypothetical protein